MGNRPRARKVFTSGSAPSSGGSGGRSGGGSPGCLPIIIVILGLIFGGGGIGLNSMLGSDSGDYQQVLTSGSGSYSGWYDTANVGYLNDKVDKNARDKYTKIWNGGNDTVTVMVYMCGTDLESKSGMATRDLNEMLNASVGDNVNLIVYTGGCKSWRNDAVSSRNNQIWQIKDGRITCLVEDAGKDSMTKPGTLSTFIKWADKHYPANRRELIFWDHGGGSISGYGYDEKNPYSGSMTLKGINTALRDAGIKYDFIGFDACLMATSETALMLSEYADYLIGSEEAEPGIGWYYTTWLSQLSSNTSTPTLQIGRTIADDFTAHCAKTCPGQAATLSVVDLAELSQTLPAALNAFAKDSSAMISDGEYKSVAKARSSSKEFSPSIKIDQIDLAHFAKLMGTSEGKKLADTVISAVKYNSVSRNMVNAYGLSIYFPYRALNKVDTVASTYNEIGIDGEYTDCIQKFAQMEVSGQAVAGSGSYGGGQGGGISPFDILLGGSGSGSGSGGSQLGQQAMEQLIGNLLSGSFSDFSGKGLEGLDRSNTKFLSQGDLDAAAAAEYISENRITADDLVWEKNSKGQTVIRLTEEQWDTIEKVDMQLFYDDGKGFIDLGLDNIYDFDSEGNLVPYDDRNWISLDGQVVAYYHTDTVEKGNDEYVITGYVPVKLNGERANLILSFDNENEQGYVAGVSYDYDKKITETAAKNLVTLEKGDRIQFVCDYYTNSGKIRDGYQLGKTMTVNDPEDIEILNTDLGLGKTKVTYKFTDIYGQEYWTQEVK